MFDDFFNIGHDELIEKYCTGCLGPIIINNECMPRKRGIECPLIKEYNDRWMDNINNNSYFPTNEDGDLY